MAAAEAGCGAARMCRWVRRLRSSFAFACSIDDTVQADHIFTTKDAAAWNVEDEGIGGAGWRIRSDKPPACGYQMMQALTWNVLLVAEHQQPRCPHAPAAGAAGAAGGGATAPTAGAAAPAAPGGITRMAMRTASLSWSKYCLQGRKAAAGGWDPLGGPGPAAGSSRDRQAPCKAFCRAWKPPGSAMHDPSWRRGGCLAARSPSGALPCDTPVGACQLLQADHARLAPVLRGGGEHVLAAVHSEVEALLWSSGSGRRRVGRGGRVGWR